MAVAADKGVVVVDDMQCSNHPYKNNNNPGGICAFCLQEKLGRLVSSSKSDPSFFPVNTPPAPTAAAGDSSSSPSSLITARSSNSGFGTSNRINIKNAAAALALGIASSSAHDNHNNKTATTTSSSSNMMIMTAGTNSNIHHDLLQKKTRKSPIATTNSYSLSEQHQNNKLVMLKRSKSTAASNTRRIISHEPRHQIFDNDVEEEELGTNEYCPAAAKSATRNKHHRGFWSSFLHLTSASNRTSKRTIRSSPYGERDHRDRMAVLSNITATNTNSITISSAITEKENQLGGGNESTSSNSVVAASSSTGTRDTIGGYGDENDSPNSSSHASSSNSFGRKVARSRSVGCGSRSFSGAFLEKISTGFGDCSTLRRVESQRESSTTNSSYHNTNNKMVVVDDHHHRRNHHRHIKERVKCGGIFGGFTMSNTSNNISNGGRVVAAVVGPPHGRSRNWGWAFASPMRGFRPPTSSSPSSSSKPDGSVVAAAPKDIWFV